MLGICLAVMLTGAVMINGPRKIEDGQGEADRIGQLEQVT